MRNYKKSRQFLGSLVCILLCHLLTAQNNPHFEMILHFEDAIGNRDSVLFGYDIDATEEIDEEFEEFELTSPFDSIFEVRIGSRDVVFHGDKLTKRLIVGTEVVVNDPTCFSGAGAYIYIHAVHQPIKIWWDKEQLLNNECYRGGFIINHIADELGGPFSPDEIPPLYYCMSNIDTAFFNTSTEEMQTSEWPIISIEKEIEGQGIQTIYGLRLIVNPSWSYTPCYWVTDTGQPTKIYSLLVFPNPVKNIINLQLPSDVEVKAIEVYSSMGKLVHQQKRFSKINEIDVSHLNPGLFYIRITSTKNDVFITTFIKEK